MKTTNFTSSVLSVNFGSGTGGTFGVWVIFGHPFDKQCFNYADSIPQEGGYR
jgi:hypothetical protein